MSAGAARRSLSSEVAEHLPYLRRYARALTGSQESGDAHVAALLEALIAEPGLAEGASEPKAGLYRAFHRLWESTGPAADGEEAGADAGGGGPEAVVQGRLSKLAGPARQALLLSEVEGFAPGQVAEILGVTQAEAGRLLADAVAELDRQTRSRALIIEDEPVIAMDVEAILDGMGHQVIDVAATREEAVAIARRERPDLILADIRLADGSSGIDAVQDILGFADAPVIFVTAYPERLLTGARPEPTYLITKPFETASLRAAVSQALFFAERAHV
ncbi:MAG: response regulator [Pseudomonadota bacterium]